MILGGLAIGLAAVSIGTAVGLSWPTGSHAESKVEVFNQSRQGTPPEAFATAAEGAQGATQIAGFEIRLPAQGARWHRPNAN